MHVQVILIIIFKSTCVCIANMQDFDGEEFLECIKDLLRIDREWVPRAENCSLYIRPTMIGTEVSS